MSAHAIWLAVAIAAQAPTEIPDDWKRDLRAAGAALEARDFVKAEALLVQVVRASQELDENDPRQIAPLEKLALFYLTEGVERPADAEPLLRRVLTVQEKTAGLESPDLVDTLVALAACRLKVDPRAGEEVEQLDRRALSITEKAYGKDDLRTAAVLKNLATTHIHRKQYEPAERALERAIAIREKANLSGDLKLADLLDALGDLHFLLFFEIEIPADIRLTLKPQDSPEAFAQRIERRGRLINSYYMRALSIREKALGPDSTAIAERLKNLAFAAAFSGRWADIVAYFARWLAIHERTKQEPSEEQAGILSMCGDAAAKQKHWADAERWFARAQSVIEQLKGADSGEAAFARVLRAEVATDAERFDDAESFLKQALIIQTELIGNGHMSVRQVRDMIGGRFQDHAADPKGYRFWAVLTTLGTHLRDPAVDQGGLADIIDAYVKLLRRTNRAVQKPDEADLAYLRTPNTMKPSGR